MMILELDIVKNRRPQAIWEDAVDLFGGFRLHGCYLLIGLDEY
jgi:hypothetical protein